MARKSPKCPPTVEPNEFGCVWNFSGMFDHHHHGRPHRKLLSDESHGSKSLSGGRQARSQVRMLTFDEQLKNINNQSKKKAASVNQSVKEKTSYPNHTRKNDNIRKHTVEKSFWKRIISRNEGPKKKNKDPNFVDRIVVLKPSQNVVERPVDVGCRCSNLQPHRSSTNKQQIVKHNQISFNDVRKKLKNAKKLKNNRKMKSCEAPEGGETGVKLPLVPFSKEGEPEVFVKARRHLAERLRQIARSEWETSTSSNQQASRSLERILLSSPVHGSMATFGGEPEGSKTRTGSSPLNQNEDSSTSGFLEIMDTDDSPKVDCQSGNINNDDIRENPSPVSVLDSFFADNICSPTSAVESGKYQPRRLDFEECSSQTSSPPHHKISLSSLVEDRGFVLSHVNAIYQISHSNWEDFLAMDYPLESSCDHKLLHDCVKEVLIGLHSRIAFISSKIRPFSVEKDVVNEVIEQIDWHNGQPVGPRTLDHLVSRDIAKCGRWADISDRNDVVFEVVDETIEVLIMEFISEIRL